MGINNLVITGYVGKKIETFQFGTGGEGLKFSFVAVEKVKDEDKSIFFQVTLFGKLVDQLKNTLSEGDMVIISGKIGVYFYRDKEGKSTNIFQITANNVEILSPSQKKEKTPEKKEVQQDFIDDDIPF